MVFGRFQKVSVDIGGFIHVRYNEMKRSFERANMLNPVELHRDHRKEVGIIWK